MRRALAEAELGRGKVEPNPLVGAVVTAAGELVGYGRHERFGGPHAEVEALRKAGARTRGATLYVTLEPCCHHGKTPPCTDAIVAAGIVRVVAAMRDPFPKVAGQGERLLRERGVSVELGLLEPEARRLNAPYLKRLETGLAYVTAKWAMTLDGKIATASGDSRWISGERSRANVHDLRGRMDAIVVGIGTALADDPELTARPPGPRTPVRIVLDRRARLPLESKLARSLREAEVWVVADPAAPEANKQALADLGIRVLEIPGAEVATLLRKLASEGMTNILVEGGGKVLGSFWDAGQIDAIEVYLAPLIEGGAHANTPIAGLGIAQMALAKRLSDISIAQLDDDIQVRGTIDWKSAPRNF